jgi:hypothetical protein
MDRILHLIIHGLVIIVQIGALLLLAAIVLTMVGGMCVAIYKAFRGQLD